MGSCLVLLAVLLSSACSHTVEFRYCGRERCRGRDGEVLRMVQGERDRFYRINEWVRRKARDNRRTGEDGRRRFVHLSEAEILDAECALYAEHLEKTTPTPQPEGHTSARELLERNRNEVCGLHERAAVKKNQELEQKRRQEETAAMLRDYNRRAAQQEAEDAARREKIQMLKTLGATAKVAQEACKARKPVVKEQATHLTRLWRLAKKITQEHGAQAMAAATGLIENTKESCKHTVPNLVQQGGRLMKAGDPFGARDVFDAVLWITPEDTAATKGRERAASAAARIIPQRIKTVYVQPEGEGFVGYVTLVSADGQFTAAPGHITFQVYSASRTDEPCYEHSREVNTEDFSLAVLGQGAFEHQAIIYKIPYVKWAELDQNQCHWPLSQIRDRRVFQDGCGLRAVAIFRTERGETMNAVEDFPRRSF